VLFGALLRGDGADGQWARDTWEWDGPRGQVEDAGGAKRRSHCWAYDRDRKRMSWWGHNKCVTAADGKGIRKFDHDGLRK
jgi:hypothetical protein